MTLIKMLHLVTICVVNGLCIGSVVDSVRVYIGIREHYKGLVRDDLIGAERANQYLRKRWREVEVRVAEMLLLVTMNIALFVRTYVR